MLKKIILLSLSFALVNIFAMERRDLEGMINHMRVKTKQSAHDVLISINKDSTIADAKEILKSKKGINVENKELKPIVKNWLGFDSKESALLDNSNVKDVIRKYNTHYFSLDDKKSGAKEAR